MGRVVARQQGMGSGLKESNMSPTELLGMGIYYLMLIHKDLELIAITIAFVALVGVVRLFFRK